MRPVARIAQSVEQGIENPRVLGSIPSSGTILKNPALWLGFCFWAPEKHPREVTQIAERKANVAAFLAAELQLLQ